MAIRNTERSPLVKTDLRLNIASVPGNPKIMTKKTIIIRNPDGANIDSRRDNRNMTMAGVTTLRKNKPLSTLMGHLFFPLGFAFRMLSYAMLGTFPKDSHPVDTLPVLKTSFTKSPQ